MEISIEKKLKISNTLQPYKIVNEENCIECGAHTEDFFEDKSQILQL